MIDSSVETLKHISRVRDLLNLFVKELLYRGENHDRSKLESPEKELFDVATEKLSKLTYGTPEYHTSLKEIQPALDHHYANNSHHPQFHKNGINDMTLVDLIEMFCDWKAASERHHDGNIRKSIEHNAGRFEMSPQLTKIFENTVKYL